MYVCMYVTVSVRHRDSTGNHHHHHLRVVQYSTRSSITPLTGRRGQPHTTAVLGEIDRVLLLFLPTMIRGAALENEEAVVVPSICRLTPLPPVAGPDSWTDPPIIETIRSVSCQPWASQSVSCSGPAGWMDGWMDG